MLIPAFGVVCLVIGWLIGTAPWPAILALAYFVWIVGDLIDEEVRGVCP